MMSALDDTLAALADPTRRHVVDLLSKRPRRAGELAAALDMSAPAMSRHLRVLRRSGLIEEGEGDADDARVRMYRLRAAPFEGLRSWADEALGFWTEQLAGFKEHVERTRGRRAGK
ncbi:MAG: winged helix-turn-helix transcriptional regulator [Deltaproteobacteria bacterium]|nr:winged helix-turn-helix transcriptional regulator [Deltaproteobacteria bacterium]